MPLHGLMAARTGQLAGVVPCCQGPAFLLMCPKDFGWSVGVGSRDGWRFLSPTQHATPSHVPTLMMTCLPSTKKGFWNPR